MVGVKTGARLLKAAGLAGSLLLGVSFAAQASTIVFSPGSALPRSLMPCAKAWNRALKSASASVALPLTAEAARMKAVA